MNSTLKSILRMALPRGIKRQRIWGGPLKGRWLVTSWHDYPAALTGRTERPLLAWFFQQVKPAETWLDIGAHYGYTAIALSELVGAQGRVFAFEPTISTAGYLAQTRAYNKLPQLTVLPYALGIAADLEVKQLPVTRGMVDSTIHQHGDWLETIHVARFDWLWPRIDSGQEQIDGVKIDVQGMEIEVVRGMVETLTQYKPQLVIEVHRGVDRLELLALLERIGYSPEAIPIEPVPGETVAQLVDDHSYAFVLK
jgi:FkbM family methyltransferase